MAYLTNAGTVLLVGTADADTLDATVSLLTTMLIGGLGNDTYIINDNDINLPDVIVEEAGGGTDTVRSYTTHILAAFVENLVLLDDDDLDGTGNGLNNSLTGNSGENKLDGGAGNDTLAGGLGDDEYRVDSSLDVIIEAANAGNDKVISTTVSYVLAANIEELELEDDSAALNGTGNAGDNYLVGNDANNVLAGMAGNDLLEGGAGNDRLDGGAGNDRLIGEDGVDTLIGGAGDDTFIVESDDALVVEAVNGGNDTVETGGNHTLAANVENLILTSNDSSTLRGNAVNNYIQGGSGNDSLFGEAGNDTLDGKGGADIMTGGAGNDVYVVDDAGDRIIEAAGAAGGTADKVMLSWYFMVLPDNVENIQLISIAVNAYGNNLNNLMVGNASNNFLLAFDGNDILDGGGGADNLQGGKGNDTYYFDNVNDYAQEMRGEGTDTVFTSVSYNFYGLFNIENMTLTGTADGQITGNALGNIITGDSGNNFLDGREGADTMRGGLGNDTYVVEHLGLGDKVEETTNAGTDTVYSYVAAYTLAANVENLVLGNIAGNINGTGNALNNQIDGNAAPNGIFGGGGDDVLKGFGGNDALIGEGGNDFLDGGVGMDTMRGGAGNDTYVVNTFDDVVEEIAGAGTDTVRSFVNWELGANLENLTLLAGAIGGSGNALANTIIGTDGDNVLTGAAGNDVLDGGLGEDVMDGGIGDDRYVVDNEDDVIQEGPGGGTDTVQTTISRGSYDEENLDDDLTSLWDNVENLVMLGTDGLQAKGNDLSNTIKGNSGNNVLSGEGLGTDTLAGGKGDDLYVVDQATDVIRELSSEGVDTVILDFTPAVTYALGANLEILRLVNLGSAAVNANGNALDNGLEGTTGNNVLDGGAGNDYIAGRGGADTLRGGLGNDYLDGGTGADNLQGGAGDDTYVVDADDNPAQVTEGVTAGTDTVHSTANWTLGANFENLALLGAGNLSGTGNNLNNSIYGNLGNNTLSGGAGNDTFYFHSYDVDVRAWQPVTDVDFFTFSATLDGGDVVNGGDSSDDDALYAAIFDLNGDALQITGVEEITLYSGTNGSGGNVIDAAGIVGANRITIRDMRPEDDQGSSTTADMVLNNLDPETDFALVDFHAGLTLEFEPDGEDDIVTITLGSNNLGSTINEGVLTTQGIGTVVLDVQQPPAGPAVAAFMANSTGLEHVQLSSLQGEIVLTLPASADLSLDNANINVYLGGYAAGPMSIGLNNSGASFFLNTGNTVQLELDTTGSDGESFISTQGAVDAELLTVVGNQGLSISIGQSIDASAMTGNLRAGVDGAVGNFGLKGGLGSDILNGGSGNDSLNGGSDGNDVLFGNGGTDNFVFDSAPTEGHYVYMPDFTSGQDRIELDPTIFAAVAGGVDSNNFHYGDVSEMAGKNIAFDINTGNLYYSATGQVDDAELFGNTWYRNVEASDFTISV